MFTVNYRHYLKDYKMAIVDYDYLQHSIARMRKQNTEQVMVDEENKRMRMNSSPDWEIRPTRCFAVRSKRPIATVDKYFLKEKQRILAK